jgi:demethylmenaquinone methyltransferase/2-methoxy-6-polyprenyl-1,4-benzoquinol methylase
MDQYQLPTPEKKPEYVKSNFDHIAKAYDQFNDWNSFFLHRKWKNWIITQAIKENPNAKIALDLCCGTGDITLRLSKVSGLEEVTGLDFSENMLSFAKQKIGESSRIKLVIGDAMNLKNFNDSSIDLVTMGFGLRNVSDLQKCLYEIKRVLKPGGIFINLDVGRVRPFFLKWFADFYFFKMVPVFGYLIYGKKHEMFDYLPHSSTTYPDQETLQKTMYEIGFLNVRFQNFVFGNAVGHIARK